MSSVHNIQVAAFDVGSNAVRCGVGKVDPAFSVTETSFKREPLALGRVVNQVGLPPQPIPGEMIESISSFFGSSLQAIRDQQIPRGAIIAVGTSAVRTAPNRQALVDEITRQHGLKLKVIDGLEEGRLSALGCVYRIPSLRDGRLSALVIEIGGGSLQASFITKGSLGIIGSYELGSTKILSRYDGSPLNTPDFARFVEAELAPARDEILGKIGGRRVDMVIGLGGAAAEIRHQLGEGVSGCTPEGLTSVIAQFSSASDDQRGNMLNHQDRGLVVMPASIIFHLLTQNVGAHIFHPGNTGLREGLYLDVAQRLRRIPEAAQEAPRVS